VGTLVAVEHDIDPFEEYAREGDDNPTTLAIATEVSG
jgi:hypothetical protein